MHFDKEQIWKLTLPQVNYYLKKCQSHIEFTIKVQSMSLSALFGGGSSDDTPQTGTYINSEGKEVIDGYEVATAEDMEWLASIL